MSDIIEPKRPDFSKPPLPHEQTGFTVDWKYPAFHFVMPKAGQKPPLNTPLELPIPKGVRHPERNKYIFVEKEPVETFLAFKGRFRSRINHNEFLVVWIYAPNKAIAMKYADAELHARSPA